MIVFISFSGQPFSSCAMSFGFSISDVIAVSSLARQLFKDIYLVARDAPEELQLLKTEIGVLSLSIELLSEEFEDENSTLVQAKETKMKLADLVMQQSKATLKELEAFAKKYDFNQVTRKGRGRRIWDRVKFSTDIKSIALLRAKITQYNGAINLLLTSAGK
jgi:hypothetical protein